MLIDMVGVPERGRVTIVGYSLSTAFEVYNSVLKGKQIYECRCVYGITPEQYNISTRRYTVHSCKLSPLVSLTRMLSMSARATGHPDASSVADNALEAEINSIQHSIKRRFTNLEPWMMGTSYREIYNAWVGKSLWGRVFWFSSDGLGTVQARLHYLSLLLQSSEPEDAKRLEQLLYP